MGLNSFTLRREQLPLLPAAAAPETGRLRILHISDLHYVPGQRKKQKWVQSLADLEPDLVVNTGDNLSHPEAVPEVLTTLGPLLQFPGVFVPGSNDYYGPQLKNPLKYLRGPSELRQDAEPDLPTEELFSAFRQAGWHDLTNAHTRSDINGLRLDLSGTDDPHINRDQPVAWPEREEAEGSALRIGVTHAPVSRVLTQFAATGADLILAGHTHGGQVCLPSFSRRGGRALVTNCDLPTAQAKGLSTVTAAGRTVPLHVSAGLGTSRTAPIRLFCPPEATVLDLGVAHTTAR